MNQNPLPQMDEFEEEKIISPKSLDQRSPLCNTTTDPNQNQVEGFPSSQKQEPPPTPVKGSRNRRNSLDEDKNVNRGHWLLEENKKYHWFLQIHYRHFVNRHMRRMDKIFKTMETFVGTRQAEQCRSHHQKMEKKYHNFITIISNLRHQHYNTSDIEPIVEDITANGIALSQNLATIPMLIEEESNNTSVVEVKERRKSTSPKCEEVIIDQLLNPQEIQEQKDDLQAEQAYEANPVVEIPDIQCSVNMWDESHLNIGEIKLYHEKDQISGLFQFH